MQKVNYISNKELLAEIQRSKATYCHFVHADYVAYDAVVSNIDAITPTLVTSILQEKNQKLAKSDGIREPFRAEQVIFRVMTDSHIPSETDEKRRKKSSTGEWIARTNFPPFRHYAMIDGELREVGRSHWRGSLTEGRFDATHGTMTRRLAQMFMLLVEQYSKRANWRDYSYVSEMKGHALVQLSQVGLQFDESRSDNPFAWCTQIVKNVFRRVLLLEKRCQEIRDDLLIMSGVMPSHTRQVDNEMDQRDGWDAGYTPPVKAKSDPEVKKVPAKRGRKPKVRTQ